MQMVQRFLVRRISHTEPICMYYTPTTSLPAAFLFNSRLASFFFFFFFPSTHAHARARAPPHTHSHALPIYLLSSCRHRLHERSGFFLGGGGFFLRVCVRVCVLF